MFVYVCVCDCMCVSLCCTCRAEASIDAVTVTGVAGLWVRAGISTGTPTLLVLHCVGTGLPCECIHGFIELHLHQVSNNIDLHNLDC